MFRKLEVLFHGINPDPEKVSREWAEKLKAASHRNACAKQRMMSKPCPMMNNNNCHDMCVHFKEGTAFQSDDSYWDGYVFESAPACKLWK